MITLQQNYMHLQSNINANPNLIEVEMIDLRYHLKLLTGMSYKEFTKDLMIIRLHKEGK